MHWVIELTKCILLLSNQFKTSSKVWRLSIGWRYWSLIQALIFPEEFLGIFLKTRSRINKICLPKILYKYFLSIVLILPYLLYSPKKICPPFFNGIHTLLKAFLAFPVWWRTPFVITKSNTSSKKISSNISPRTNFTLFKLFFFWKF